LYFRLKIFIFESNIKRGLVILVRYTGQVIVIKKVVSMSDKLHKTDSEWREQLTEEAYRVCRDKGTERAYTGRYWDHHEKGVFTCACCSEPLFSSASKFDSGTGWPSYSQPINEDAINEHEDRGLLATRTEVVCSKCGAHLGHVFTDGPQPTGLRYCINSVSLDFEKVD